MCCVVHERHGLPSPEAGPYWRRRGRWSDPFGVPGYRSSGGTAKEAVEHEESRNLLI